MDASRHDAAESLRPQERHPARSRRGQDTDAADRRRPAARHVFRGRRGTADAADGPPRRQRAALGRARLRALRGRDGGRRDLPDRCSGARPVQRLPRARGNAGRSLRQARRLGLHPYGDPARYDVGLLHAARLGLGQAVDRADARRRPAADHRGVLRPRQLRRVPPVSRGPSRPRRRAHLSGAQRGLSALLLARRRDHRGALPCRGRRCRRVRAARRRGAAELRRRRLQRRLRHRAREHGRRLAGRRPMPRLLPAVVQLPPAQLRTVHHGARTPRQSRGRAALQLRVHRVERQSLGATRHRLQGSVAARVHRGPLRQLRRHQPRPLRQAAGGGAFREDRAHQLHDAVRQLRDRAPGVVLPQRRPRRRARQGAQPRRDLGRPAATRSVRHQRAAHLAVVRSHQRAGQGKGADG